MKRKFSQDEAEWMDLPSPDPVALQKDLENLETINRVFGGKRAVRKLFAELVGERKRVRMIDLATGFGDHPRQLSEWARDKEMKLHVIGVDFQRKTLELARQATAKTDPIYYLQADVRHLPFKDESVDFAFCNLALHHFSEEDAQKILGESHRISTKGAVCLDLVRRRLAYVAAWLLTKIWMREPMTKHDALLSVWRAFTKKELKSLAHNAGWANFWHIKLPWFRQAVVLQKKI